MDDDDKMDEEPTNSVPELEDRTGNVTEDIASNSPNHSINIGHLIGHQSGNATGTVQVPGLDTSHQEASASIATIQNATEIHPTQPGASIGTDSLLSGYAIFASTSRDVLGQASSSRRFVRQRTTGPCSSESSPISQPSAQPMQSNSTAQVGPSQAASVVAHAEVAQMAVELSAMHIDQNANAINVPNDPNPDAPPVVAQQQHAPRVIVYIDMLPDDMMVLILINLPARDLLKVAIVSKNWLRLQRMACEEKKTLAISRDIYPDSIETASERINREMDFFQLLPTARNGFDFYACDFWCNTKYEFDPQFLLTKFPNIESLTLNSCDFITGKDVGRMFTGWRDTLTKLVFLLSFEIDQEYWHFTSTSLLSLSELSHLSIHINLRQDLVIYLPMILRLEELYFGFEEFDEDEERQMFEYPQFLYYVNHNNIRQLGLCCFSKTVKSFRNIYNALNEISLERPEIIRRIDRIMLGGIQHDLAYFMATNCQVALHYLDIELDNEILPVLGSFYGLHELILHNCADDDNVSAIDKRRVTRIIRNTQPNVSVNRVCLIGFNRIRAPVTDHLFPHANVHIEKSPMLVESGIDTPSESTSSSSSSDTENFVMSPLVSESGLDSSGTSDSVQYPMSPSWSQFSLSSLSDFTPSPNTPSNAEHTHSDESNQ